LSTIILTTVAPGCIGTYIVCLSGEQRALGYISTIAGLRSSPTPLISLKSRNELSLSWHLLLHPTTPQTPLSVLPAGYLPIKAKTKTFYRHAHTLTQIGTHSLAQAHTPFGADLINQS